MEKVRPWCGQPSDRGRLKNRTEQSTSRKQYTISEEKRNLEKNKDKTTLWIKCHPRCLFHIHESRLSMHRPFSAVFQSRCHGEDPLSNKTRHAMSLRQSFINLYAFVNMKSVL